MTNITIDRQTRIALSSVLPKSDVMDTSMIHMHTDLGQWPLGYRSNNLGTWRVLGPRLFYTPV
jgi:hypothetical protein